MAVLEMMVLASTEMMAIACTEMMDHMEILTYTNFKWV